MKLIYVHSGKEVEVGDIVRTTKGEQYRVTGWRKPHKPSSTGRVIVKEVPTDLLEPFKDQEFFPNVINAAWVDREDQTDFAGKFMKQVQWGYE